MEALPQNLKYLKEIKELLDQYMMDPSTPVEIRTTDLYDLVKNRKQLKKAFPTSYKFNRFLREEHQKGVLLQIIPNCRVDDTDQKFYQWYFRRAEELITKSKISNTTRQSETPTEIFKSSLSVVAIDGKKLRSNQEKIIYESLISSDFLDIQYDALIVEYGERVYADFIIENRLSKKKYIWEHFGMTNSSLYLDKMVDKIEWYKHNGYKEVAKGGELIYTYYKNDKTFRDDVIKWIKLVSKKPIDISYTPASPNDEPDQKVQEIPEISLFSDGGADPNPGKGGFGIILDYKGRRKEFCQGYKLTTNNRMEIMGVIYGLKKLKKKAIVQVFTDSKYLVDAITLGWAQKWKANNWFRNNKTKASNYDLWDELLSLIDNQESVTFNWIKGHNGHPDNERCDALATFAINGDNLIEDEGYGLKTLFKIENEGDKCRKCGVAVVKRIPKKRNNGKAYSYKYYLYCPGCKSMYMVEKAKITEDAPNTLF